MTIQPIKNSIAWHAIRAARNVDTWGRFAAYRYCQTRGALPYYTLARVLVAAERSGL